METIMCPRCNKMFNYIRGVKLCKECDQIVFDKIKTFLKENRGSTAGEIHRSLGIPTRIVEEYMKDDRIQEVLPQETPRCPLCGNIAMETSNLCKNCYSKKMLKESMQQDKINKLKTLKQEIKPTGTGMHFINKEDGRKR